ncbi:MAG TPA: diheme cytochrome c-553 [Bacteroidota bacterium]|nr:diheme cytochrome c-553 [Bacteroidota bacterium]
MRQLKALIMVVAAWCCLGILVPSADGQGKMNPKMIKRGEYLVNSIGCNDCHTPFKMGPQGPEPDMTRMLSGHPQGMNLPPSPTSAPGPWIGSFAATMTAWAGPWGVSFSKNLTPDKETGLGDWTEENFVQAIRTGKDMGKGRAILPPMPWQSFKNMTDDDLKSIFAYLKSIPAIKNKVSEPMPPAQPMGGK